MIALIVARAKNNVIGSKNQIPWRIRADLIRLKQLTLGRVVILGRKTYESMVGYYNKSGRDMPARQYIVITSNRHYQPAKPKSTVAHSFAAAMQIAKSSTSAAEEIFVIGGAQTYASALPFAKRIYLTEVDFEPAGDVAFPKLNLAQWREVFREPHQKDEKNAHNYSFVTLEKR